MSVVQTIRERGPITVAAFMDLALYHPDFGYYSRSSRPIGRAGDFFTSIDVGPLFGDLLDIVNPLHHLPGVGTIYRAITGDQIGNLPRLIGSFALGGPLGLAGGMVSVTVKDMTGRDPAEHVAALVGLEPAGAPAPAVLDEQPVAPSSAGAPPPEAAAPAAPEPVVAAAPKPLPVVPDHPPMPLARTPRISVMG